MSYKNIYFRIISLEFIEIIVWYIFNLYNVLIILLINMLIMFKSLFATIIYSFSRDTKIYLSTIKIKITYSFYFNGNKFLWLN